MNEQETNLEGQALAFLRLWTESFSKLGQAAFSFSPDSAPPEMLRQVRAGMFQALAQSWDEFMRSPQFLESLKQMMDNAVAFRKISADFLTKARHELGGVAQEDLAGVLLSVRQSETRILDRLEALSNQVADLSRRLDQLESSRSDGRVGSSRKASRSKRSL
jgi:hypothetical protein